MQTETVKTSPKTSTPNFVKVSVTQRDLPKEKKAGETYVLGKFVEFKKTPFQRVNNKFEMEEKEFKQIVVEHEGTKIAYPCDMGLYQTIQLASVKPGDLIKCVWLEKKQIKNGNQSMNVWDVFVAQ